MRSGEKPQMRGLAFLMRQGFIESLDVALSIAARGCQKTDSGASFAGQPEYELIQQRVAGYRTNASTTQRYDVPLVHDRARSNASAIARSDGVVIFKLRNGVSTR